ncbi:hypothetical protein AWC38_SpisGene25826 [Stylophora pistillata]|uniref:Uncharacterized protein n=1 Tax=Stylophora pistillata TaxID=50429 RepID=A0A2B4S7P2_STYPI|nr:hypothetical protein AWC38_SpisGene25826 [Stylophora pistillata]
MTSRFGFGELLGNVASRRGFRFSQTQIIEHTVVSFIVFNSSTSNASIKGKLKFTEIGIHVINNYKKFDLQHLELGSQKATSESNVLNTTYHMQISLFCRFLLQPKAGYQGTRSP